VELRGRRFAEVLALESIALTAVSLTRRRLPL
jgi:hypothetical protein